MSNLAEEVSWYSSSTFLGWAAIVVAVLLGGLGLWAAFRSASPLRRIYVTTEGVTSMVHTPQGLEGIIEVRREGEVLNDPYVVTVVLECRGRRDISNEDFNAAAPIKVSLGVGMLNILAIRSVVGDLKSPIPVVSIDDGYLNVGPCLLKKNQSLRVTLLTEGKPNSLNVDAELINADALSSSAPARIRGSATLAVSLFLTGLVLVVFSIFSSTLAIQYCQENPTGVLPGGNECVKLMDQGADQGSGLMFSLPGFLALFAGIVMMYHRRIERLKVTTSEG